MIRVSVLHPHVRSSFPLPCYTHFSLKMCNGWNCWYSVYTKQYTLTGVSKPTKDCAASAWIPCFYNDCFMVKCTYVQPASNALDMHLKCFLGSGSGTKYDYHVRLFVLQLAHLAVMTTRLLPPSHSFHLVSDVYLMAQSSTSSVCNVLPTSWKLTQFYWIKNLWNQLCCDMNISWTEFCKQNVRPSHIWW